ncbi:DNA-binding transcriptional LysR family regulator [Rhizobium sp. BK399]|nr:DNA-binding transcriptional LysR family regulator [Rhizobium sp. BK399]
MQRTTRQISLTEAGQGFYDRVLGILAGIEEAEYYISGRSAQMQGTLKVTAPTSFGRTHVAPHLKSFMDMHPGVAINLVLSDEFTDIVGEGFDLAIRIAELTDSSLVARRLAPVRRLLCASPDYLSANGTPETIEDLKQHRCLPAHNNDAWRLEGPEGPLSLRPEGMLVTNSSEVVREAVISGLGIALRSTWDISRELKDGRLVHILPAYEGSRSVTLSAIYPSRQFLPAKVRLFIDYLAEVYGPVPYWER